MLNNFKIGDYIYRVDKNEIEKCEIKEIIPYRYVGKDIRMNEEGIWLNNNPGKLPTNTQLLKVENIHYSESKKQTSDVFTYKLNIYNETSGFGWFSTANLATNQFAVLNPSGIRINGKLESNQTENN
jgi:hypothetical protein